MYFPFDADVVGVRSKNHDNRTIYLKLMNKQEIETIVINDET